jgi:uncharacterized protein (DUF433 family)
MMIAANRRGRSDSLHSEIIFAPTHKRGCVCKFSCRTLPQRCIISTDANDNSFAYWILMTEEELLARVTVDPEICAGKPFIQGTRISVAIILDALAQGLSAGQIVEHYPSLETDDVHAALAFATQLAEKNGGIAVVGRQYLQIFFHPR